MTREEDDLEAAKEAGGTIHRDFGGELQSRVTRPDGGITCARVTASDGRYRLQIIDEKPLQYIRQQTLHPHPRRYNQ
jgi:hypothetical protein